MDQIPDRSRAALSSIVRRESATQLALMVQSHLHRESCRYSRSIELDERNYGNSGKTFILEKSENVGNFEFEIAKFIMEELCHTAVDLYKNTIFAVF